MTDTLDMSQRDFEDLRSLSAELAALIETINHRAGELRGRGCTVVIHNATALDCRGFETGSVLHAFVSLPLLNTVPEPEPLATDQPSVLGCDQMPTRRQAFEVDLAALRRKQAMEANAAMRAVQRQLRPASDFLD